VTVLSRRAARTFYNVADALAPEAGDVDLVPELERRLRFGGAAAARRLWLLLALLEWQPLVTLRARRGFSWLPRAARREVLDGWARSRLPARRRARRWLDELVREGLAAQSEPGA
jgi:hypothetical protein